MPAELIGCTTFETNCHSNDEPLVFIFVLQIFG